MPTGALAKAATDTGVEIRTQARVASIQIIADKAIGAVLANGAEISNSVSSPRV